MNDLWDFLPDLPDQPHEAAKSKRPQPFDAQPTQQRMRGQIKPGNRRNISTDEKKVRRQMRQNGQTKTASQPSSVGDHTAEPEWDTAEHYDLCKTCGWPVKKTTSGWEHEDKNPQQWTDKRKSASTTHTEEIHMNSSTFAQEEAALLQRMASATNTFEQTEAAQALDTLRNARRDQIASDGFLDMEAAMNYDGSGVLSNEGMAPLSRAQSSLGRTQAAIVSEGSGDWLDDIETMQTSSAVDRDHAMRTEATLWYSDFPDSLKGDREEFSRQARSASARLAAQYTDEAQQAYATFLDTVDHIHTHAGFQPTLRTADQAGNGWAGFDPMSPPAATDLQTGDHGFGSGSSLPVGVSPAQSPQTADGLVNGGDTTLDSASGQSDQKSTDTDKAPSLDRGSAPATGTTPSGPDNPIADDKTLDHSTQPGPDNWMSIDGYPSGGRKAGGVSQGSIFDHLFNRHAPEHAAGPGQTTEMTTSPQAPGQHLPGKHLPGGAHQMHSQHIAAEYQGGSPKSGDTALCHADDKPIQFFDGQWMHLNGHGATSHNDVYPATPKERADKAKSAMASLASSGRAITSANDWAARTADNASGVTLPSASGLDDPKSPDAYADDVPSMDHGTSPDSDTSANAGQVDGNADGDLDKANTEQNPDYVPTGGSGGNPATSGPMAGTPVAGKSGSVMQIASKFRNLTNVSPNAKTFLTALAQCTDLDASVGGVTGRQMVGFVCDDPTVPQQVKAALTSAVVPPFVREAEGTSVGLSDALLEQAEQAYNRNDQDWFDGLPTGVLTQMWDLCTNIETCPAWDDEVYDALAARGHFGSKTAAEGEIMPSGSVNLYSKDGQNSPGLINVRQVWGPTSAQIVYSGYDYSKAMATATEAIAKAKAGWPEECSGARIFDTVADGDKTASKPSAKTAAGVITRTVNGNPVSFNVDTCSTCHRRIYGYGGNWAHDPDDAGPVHPDGSVAGDAHGIVPLGSLHTGAVYVDYNEFGGVNHSIPEDEFLNMVANPQNGWHAEPEFEGSKDYWATGPEGTGRRYTYVAAKTSADSWSVGDKVQRDGKTYTIKWISPAGSAGTSEADGPTYHAELDSGKGYSVDIWSKSMSNPTSAFSKVGARGNDFSISDAKNEDGEWTMSPEQIRAEMAAGEDYDPYDDDDRYGSRKVADYPEDQYGAGTPYDGPACPHCGKPTDEEGVCMNTACSWFGRFTAQTVASRKVAWVDQAQQVLDQHQHQTVDGMILDATTASALMAVYNGLSGDNKSRFASMPLEQATTIAWKIVSNHSGKTATMTVQGVSLTNVGIEGPGVGTGTAPDGTKVRFRLSPADEASLKSVLYSDMAMNFSGVDVTADEIISEQGGGNSMSGPSRTGAGSYKDHFVCPYCDYDGTGAEVSKHISDAGPKHQENGSVTDQLNEKIRREKNATLTNIAASFSS